MATEHVMQNPEFNYQETFLRALSNPAFQQLLVKDLWGTLASEGFNVDSVPDDIRERISFGVTRQMILSSSPCTSCGVCNMCQLCPGNDMGSAAATVVAAFSIPVY